MYGYCTDGLSVGWQKPAPLRDRPSPTRQCALPAYLPCSGAAAIQLPKSAQDRVAQWTRVAEGVGCQGLRSQRWASTTSRASRPPPTRAFAPYELRLTSRAAACGAAVYRTVVATRVLRARTIARRSTLSEHTAAHVDRNHTRRGCMHGRVCGRSRPNGRAGGRVAEWHDRRGASLHAGK